MSQNTFAADNFLVYYRSYQIGSNPVVNEYGYNQSGSSVTILDYNSNQIKLLKGFTVENNISGIFLGDCNTNINTTPGGNHCSQ
jgi:hypothetical protein